MKVDLQNYNFKVSEIRDILKNSLGNDLFSALLKRFNHYGLLYRIGMYSVDITANNDFDYGLMYASIDDFLHRNSSIIGNDLLDECYLRFELKLIKEDGPYNS